MNEADGSDQETPILFLSPQGLLVVLGATFLAMALSVVFAWRISRKMPQPQVFAVSVKAGFQPSNLRAEADRPIEVRFSRPDADPCTDGVVLEKLGIRLALKPNGTTTLDLPPQEPGRYDFRCAMGCLKGEIVVAKAERASLP